MTEPRSAPAPDPAEPEVEIIADLDPDDDNLDRLAGGCARTLNNQCTQSAAH